MYNALGGYKSYYQPKILWNVCYKNRSKLQFISMTRYILRKTHWLVIIIIYKAAKLWIDQNIWMFRNSMRLPFLHMQMNREVIFTYELLCLTLSTLFSTATLLPGKISLKIIFNSLWRVPYGLFRQKRGTKVSFQK